MTTQRTIALALVLALGLGGLASRAQEVHVLSVGGGPRALLGVFFNAMFQYDLTLLRDGGALSGAVAAERFALELPTGERRELAREDVAALYFGEGGDQVSLRDGSLLGGTLALEALTLSGPDGRPVTLPRAALSSVLLRQTGAGLGVEVEVEDSGEGPVQRRVFVSAGEGLRSQNLFAEFARAMTAYDLLVYADGRLWSGAVVEEAFTFESNSFGTLTVEAEKLSAIEWGGEAGRDFITLQVGDRLSGTLASPVRFRPLGLAGDDGRPLELAVSGGPVRLLSFRQPASAFGGGGHTPGLGGGPGQ